MVKCSIICDFNGCCVRRHGKAAQISALIMAGATVIGYVIGEGMTDAAAIEAEQAEQEG